MITCIVDILIILFIVMNVGESWRRGCIAGLFDIVSFVISFAAALAYYPVLSQLISTFQIPLVVANAIGFFIIAATMHSLLSYIFSYVLPLVPKRLRLHKLNRLFGIVTSVILSLLTGSFLLFLILALPLRSSIKQVITDSLLGNFIVTASFNFEAVLQNLIGQSNRISFVTVPADPVSHEKIDLQFTFQNGQIDLASETILFTTLLKERQAKGLPDIAFDASLREGARAHARDMLSRGYFSHYTPEGVSPADRLVRAGISFNRMGENLAFAPTIQIAHQGLMNSQSHRDNILSPDFTRVGIGVVDGGMYGKMIVQEFSD